MSVRTSSSKLVYPENGFLCSILISSVQALCNLCIVSYIFRRFKFDERNVKAFRSKLTLRILLAFASALSAPMTSNSTYTCDQQRKSYSTSSMKNCSYAKLTAKIIFFPHEKWNTLHDINNQFLSELNQRALHFRGYQNGSH